MTTSRHRHSTLAASAAASGWPSSLAAAALVLCLLGYGLDVGQAEASERERSLREARLAEVQRLTDDMRAGLSIQPQVIVAFVDRNPLVASVQPPKQPDGAYVLSMEVGFVDTLADDELEAVVAHELGHVWIYSNHPYLQTEQLANRIAMRRVTRDSLERVYEKLWGSGALKGSLSNFLGLPPAVKVIPPGDRTPAAVPASQ